MRFETRRTLATEERWLVFSEAERRVLLHAATIAEQARERCADNAGGVNEWEDDPQDMDLAHVEHGARAIVDGIVVSEKFGVGFLT